MNLHALLLELNELDDDATIYASRPFEASSGALVAIEPDEGGVPEVAISRGYSYFLEVGIAKEVLEGWSRHVGCQANAEDAVARIIEYAINDA